MSSKITELLPPMLTGAELNKALRQLPEAPTDDFRRNATQTERLIALSDLYDVFIPNQMAEEIYTKLYISLMRSLAKKQTKLATIQANQNHIAANGGIGKLGIMGGVDVFSVTGVGGIGKSSAISRSISVITQDSVIEAVEPYSRIIPVLTVQCPYDCSVKGLLFSILTGVDNLLQTNYVQRSIRTRATTDMMIAQLANTCLQHVGLLVVDEIQNVVNHKHGMTLVASITQLINSSGTALCLVGTPECNGFFQKAFHLARRTIGLEYGPLSYQEFEYLCESLLKYQYTLEFADTTPAIVGKLYEFSNGIPAVAVSLLHDAQEQCICGEKDCIDVASISAAFDSRHARLQPFIGSKVVKISQNNNAKTKRNNDCCVSLL